MPVFKPIRAATVAILMLLVGQAMGRTCDWSIPGDNKFLGSRDKAVMAYEHIPLEIRKVLAERVRNRQHDSMVTINQRGIVGPDATYSDLRMMYFGLNSLCEKIIRPTWAFDRIERGLEFTEGGHTIIVWTVCGNVSIADKTPAVAGAVIEGHPMIPGVPEKQQLYLGPARLGLPRNLTIPEPSVMWLVIAAIVALAIIGRRRR